MGGREAIFFAVARLAAPMDLPTQFDLTGRVAVVTGASRGIGRAIAVGLADAGADVVVAARSTGDLEETADRVRERGQRADVVSTDVTDPASVTALVDATVEAFDRLDVLVNNAGINPDAALGTPESVALDGFDRTLDVNLRGAFVCSQAAAEPLAAGASGSVINVASVGGVVGLPRQHPYVASKHGLVGLTRSMALDWAPAVRVNALAPGYVRTALLADVLADDDLRASLVDRTPLGRLAEPAEIAGPAVFLAADAAAYVTGACLSVDGGWSAR